MSQPARAIRLGAEMQQHIYSKVVYTTVFVSDQDKALDFYTNVLGFEKRVDEPNPGNPRFLGVGLPGQDSMVVLWPGTPGRPAPATCPIPAAVTVETSDCRKVFHDLEARGVEFEDAEPIDQPWGRVAIARDPDGNRFQIVERLKR